MQHLKNGYKNARTNDARACTDYLPGFFMDNHYHLLIETPDPNLSLGMRQLNGVYTQSFNRRHSRVGHVFQGRYKSILVQKDEHLLELCLYIVLNLVRAGMANQPKEWGWSSYKETGYACKVSTFLTVDWVLGQFANQKNVTHKGYRKFRLNAD